MHVTMRHIVYADTVIEGEALYDTDGFVYVRFFGYVPKTNMSITWHTEDNLPPLRILLKSGRETYGTRSAKNSNYYETDLGRISIGDIDTVYPLKNPATYVGNTASILQGEKDGKNT